MEKAFHSCQKAAEIGLAGTISNLTNCYYNGKGAGKDLKNAFCWYQKQQKVGMQMRSLIWQIFTTLGGDKGGSRKNLFSYW
ncbi:hypothetical protein RclHR1_03220012 [Rhizophagus clarus]|uniref:Uncharacterized protein n=1 Tax=Rhizophagus clarus TaxID=94130 RepID=A0A2Z6RMP4_9GLOM|nr:hypothetical protein RclHR1_03220012 [Rhizophagus clarus]